MNVCVPVHIPDNFSTTERHAFESAFQYVVDLVAELKRAQPEHRPRDLALLLHLDDRFVVRGSHVEGKLHQNVPAKVSA